MTRNWDSHEFSVTVSEYKHAIESLIELCILFKKRLEHAALDPEFDDCIANLHVCLNAIDHLQDGGISPAATTCSLRVDQVASILLQRSFERLCVAAEDKSSPLFDPAGKRYNSVTGLMRYTDVTHVTADVRNSKNMGKVSVDDYDFVEAGRNMIYHRTKRNVVLAMIFCTAAACRLLQFSGPKARPAASATATAVELLELLKLLQLHDEASFLQAVAESNCNPVPSDLSNLACLQSLLWGPAPPKFENNLLRFETGSKPLLLKFCQLELKHIKTKGTLALPEADTPQHTYQRCDMLAAAVALSSLTLHRALDIDSYGCVAARISVGSTAASGQRAPEQRDEFFTGRLPELKQVCDAVEAVLRNQLPASAVKHIAVLGSPGMGKSLLVSQAVLKTQKEFPDEQREVYFLKLRGRGAASVEEDLITHACSLGSKISAAADTVPSVALTNLKNYLARLRFVAIIDDANADGLRAAADWVPVSSALHLILITSYHSSDELLPLEAVYGSFTKIALCGLRCKVCGQSEWRGIRLAFGHRDVSAPVSRPAGCLRRDCHRAAHIRRLDVKRRRVRFGADAVKRQVPARSDRNRAPCAARAASPRR
jgi:hypothetical protein